MLLVKSLLALTTLLPFTTAFPSDLISRESCVDTCGSTCYLESDIAAAQNKGYSLYESGQTEGSNKYPHSENNYEGFDFPVDGPYLEFPILSSYKVYTGGSPGPDRVVFNTDNELAGVVTHTGASGNDFVQCTAD